MKHTVWCNQQLAVLNRPRIESLSSGPNRAADTIFPIDMARWRTTRLKKRAKYMLLAWVTAVGSGRERSRRRGVVEVEARIVVEGGMVRKADSEGGLVVTSARPV